MKANVSSVFPVSNFLLKRYSHDLSVKVRSAPAQSANKSPINYLKIESRVAAQTTLKQWSCHLLPQSFWSRVNLSSVANIFNNS